MTVTVDVYQPKPEVKAYDVVVNRDGMRSRYVMLADGLTMPAYVHESDSHVDLETDHLALADLPTGLGLVVEEIRSRHELDSSPWAATNGEKPSLASIASPAESVGKNPGQSLHDFEH